jgi:hypothetical protein
MFLRNSVMLHRRDDASNEYREVRLYENGGGAAQWSVWEGVGFVSGPETMRRSQRAHGCESDMRNLFHTVVGGLRKDGFVICSPESILPT